MTRGSRGTGLAHAAGMDEREKLAADLLVAERVIQFNAVHNAPHAEAAKRWAFDLGRTGCYELGPKVKATVEACSK